MGRVDKDNFYQKKTNDFLIYLRLMLTTKAVPINPPPLALTKNIIYKDMV